IVTAALTGSVEAASFVHDPIFNLDVPQQVEGVDSRLLNPRECWSNKEEYDKVAKALAGRFIDNARNKYPGMSEELIAAGPKLD
ncbi:MAG: phosphoenolpyruvate carboxykinase (ATP), partial [Atopobium minutum]|nr:phosphoenolpyruvate carboxykinase (ATP) [Atopobium minutum]